MRHPIPARLNLVLTFVQVAGSLGLLTLASHSSHLWVALSAALAFSFLMQMGFSLLHEAEHNKLHPNRRVNDAMGILLAAYFPACYTLMKELHLSHHRRNRSDAELVDYYLEGEHHGQKATLYYFLISGGVWISAPVLSLVVAFVPASLLERAFGGKKSGTAGQYLQFLQEAGQSRARNETLFAIALWAVTIYTLGLSAWALAVCYAAFAFSWSSQQYIYHIRTHRHLVEGAYNLKLWKPMEKLYLNFNYHLSHHRAPLVPWIHMDSISEEPTRPYGLTYLQIWAPPQPIEESWPQEYQKKGELLPRPSASAGSARKTLRTRPPKSAAANH